MLSGVVTAIFQTTGITMETSTQITALENIKNVARHITTDVRMASTADLTDPVHSLVLEWTIYYDVDDKFNPDGVPDELIPNGVPQRVEYTRSGTNFERNFNDSVTTDTTTIGRYISDIGFSRDTAVEGDIITVTITSSPRDRAEATEQRTYQFYLQPKEDLVQQ